MNASNLTDSGFCTTYISTPIIFLPVVYVLIEFLYEINDVFHGVQIHVWSHGYAQLC